MNNHQQFCVYITTYHGDKLPPKLKNSIITPFLYIGSSKVERVKNGYKGSVRSKKYKDIWKCELKNNADLFSIEIVSYHNSREEALLAEYNLQIENNVMKSEIFINMSVAAINGFFGSMGHNRKPFLGHKHSEESKNKISKSQSGKKFSEEHKSKISRSHKNKIMSEYTKEKLRQINTGKIVSQETRNKMSVSQKNKIFSEAHRKNLSLAATGKFFSIEHRRKLREAAKNISDETRKKLSISASNRKVKLKTLQDDVCLKLLDMKHNKIKWEKIVEYVNIDLEISMSKSTIHRILERFSKRQINND